MAKGRTACFSLEAMQVIGCTALQQTTSLLSSGIHISWATRNQAPISSVSHLLKSTCLQIWSVIRRGLSLYSKTDHTSYLLFMYVCCTSIVSCGWEACKNSSQLAQVGLECKFCQFCFFIAAVVAFEEFGTENATTPRTLLNSLREARDNDDFESFGANVKVVAKQLCFCLTPQGLNFGVSI